MKPKVRIIEETLETIYDRYGRLTPELVVAEAAIPNHPLHGYFTWDDSEAARKWRIAEARELIRTVRVQILTEDGSSKVRTWHAARNAGLVEREGYVPDAEVRTNPVTRAVLLRAMQRDWLALRRRYQAQREFWDLVSADLPTEFHKSEAV